MGCVQNGSPLVKVVALWVASLMTVAVAGILSVAWVNQRVLGPDRLVAEYFDLLRAGEGGLALGLVGAEVPDGNAILLDGAGLRASVAPIRDFRIAETDLLGEGHAAVTSTYSVDGEEYRTVFRLRQSGRDWLFFDRWAFETPELPALRVSADTTSEVTVNGIESPLAKGAQHFPLLLPAVVQAGYEDKYFEAEPKTRVVDAAATAQREPLDLVTQPTRRLVEDIDRQIREYVDGCAEQQVLKPAGCPLTYDTNARVAADTIDWDITEYPSAQVGAYDGGWVLRPLEVGTTLTLEEQDLMTGFTEEKTITESFGFTATLDVDARTVRVTPAAGD